jgi:hypothetical protein
MELKSRERQTSLREQSCSFGIGPRAGRPCSPHHVRTKTNKTRDFPADRSRNDTIFADPNSEKFNIFLVDHNWLVLFSLFTQNYPKDIETFLTD